MPYIKEYTRIKCETIVFSRQTISNSDGDEIGWYIQPTVNLTAKSSDGNVIGVSLSFLKNGNVIINGSLEEAGGLTEEQFDRLKQVAKALYATSKAVLSADLSDEEDME